MAVSPSRSLAYPWGLQLTTGQDCLAFQGAHSSYDGRIIDYYCGMPSTTGTLGLPAMFDLLRGINENTPIWTDQSVAGSTAPTLGPTVEISTAWYGWP